jgi:hypothetical protein
MTETDDWTRPDWLAEARAWIAARLGERGATITGEITQPHVQWWSTALRVPTSDGTVFFKASRPIYAFEGPLTALLAGVVPARTAEVLATDVDRAWMLTRDAGTRLREAVGGLAQLTEWEQLLPRYAELQIALAPRTRELLDIGVPDLGLESLPTLLARVVHDEDALTRDDEDGMSLEQRRVLLEQLPAFTESCRQLSRLGIPECLQHDDLHDGNVFVRDGVHVFFDWGDACISHPFHTLVVTLRALTWRLGLEPGAPEIDRLRDAYLEPWTARAPAGDLLAATDIARRTGTVQRAMAWYIAAQHMPPDVKAEEIASVPYGLKLYLEDAPFGAWEP